MSVVSGETKLKDSESKIYEELDKIGIRVSGVYWSNDMSSPERIAYHIGNSTVICEGSASCFTIIGKDHESVSKQLSGILEQVGAENVNIESIEKNNSPFRYEISKLVKLGILKEKERGV
jgi:aspartokinase